MTSKSDEHYAMRWFREQKARRQTSQPDYKAKARELACEFSECNDALCIYRRARIADALQAAADEEREACAQVALGVYSFYCAPGNEPQMDTARRIFDNIRARGAK